MVDRKPHGQAVFTQPFRWKGLLRQCLTRGGTDRKWHFRWSTALPWYGQTRLT